MSTADTPAARAGARPLQHGYGAGPAASDGAAVGSVPAVGSAATGSAPTVADLGEEELLSAISPLLPHAARVLVPSGDDSAVIPAPDGRYCVSTDVLVQGEHFRTDWSTARDVGARSAAQNLADIAAMGARPTALVVSLVLPRTTPVRWVQDLARGFADACVGTGAGVVGGDLSTGDRLVIAVTVHGDLEGRRPVLRSGAQPGDLVVHCGTLGRSAAGLALLQAGLDDRDGGWADVVAARSDAPGDTGAGADAKAEYGASVKTRDGAAEAAAYCLRIYRAPFPPLAAGPALADAGATAMLDVSDGLLRDADRIARASGVVLDIADPEDGPGTGPAHDLAVLEPVARLLREDAADARDLARAWVLTGGEDHGLLATLPPSAVDRMPGGGRVIGIVRALSDGESAGARIGGRVPGRLGWDHFRA
ncbi:thiamine-monophosphate kinase [Actinomyces sp. 565]|uniref:thiamine-phosphate kinase n=1 Tax=Actinomyces sp. 565 TaxID=2057794 RepID=UPI0013A6F661|nr:thiamine-monophosphate kinase [Actinomyces sp. 565]NDR53977.1 thiamine-monophosphate kinase [Actinomyces sp. 565]